MGRASAIYIRSGVLFAIGQKQEQEVYNIIKIHCKYFIIIIIGIALFFLIFNKPISYIFFKEDDLRLIFQKMIQFYPLIILIETIKPICFKSKFIVANNIGNNPQIIPSFRLLTNPAWEIDPKFLFRQVVSQKTFFNNA